MHKPIFDIKPSKENSKVKSILFLFLVVFSTLQLMAQDKKKFLSAKDSEPSNFGWMQGFPPSAEKTLHTSDGSFFEFPAIRWSVVHMREMLPTINVSRGLGAPNPLEYNLDKNIDAITFSPWNSKKKMTWEESLWENYTDGMLILHKGKVVYEKYFSELTENDVHAVMSLTKSFNGTLASILVAEGKLDENKLVSFYVPELKNSAYSDATVRQVMDMTTALKYSEDYADPKADIWDFSAAGNPLPKPKDYTGPEGYYEYLETVKKVGKHGEAFGYKTVNADALGWIIAKATGKSVNELLSERIWSKIGMEQDGSKPAFEKSGHPELRGWSYRNMWWIPENKNGAYTARGVHGQTIYIDPAAEMVIVRFASHPIAGNAANDATSLPAYQAVADYLMKKK